MGLDERIKSLARQEAAAAVADRSADVAGLQQQITDLHEHLHVATTAVRRLEGRLEVLEKTAAGSSRPELEQSRPTARRTRSKSTDE